MTVFCTFCSACAGKKWNCSQFIQSGIFINLPIRLYRNILQHYQCNVNNVYSWKLRPMFKCSTYISISNLFAPENFQHVGSYNALVFRLKFCMAVDMIKKNVIQSINVYVCHHCNSLEDNHWLFYYELRSIITTGTNVILTRLPTVIEYVLNFECKYWIVGRYLNTGFLCHVSYIKIWITQILFIV